MFYSKSAYQKRSLVNCLRFQFSAFEYTVSAYEYNQNRKEQQKKKIPSKVKMKLIDAHKFKGVNCCIILFLVNLVNNEKKVSLL